MFNPRIPVTINGRACVLAFDMAAAATLQKKYHLGWEELNKLDSSGPDTLDLTMKLVYCMTRSMDDPPTEKDIERMSMTEVAGLHKALMAAINISMDLGLGEQKAVAGKPAVESVSAGTSAKRLSRRSIASGSRRNSSGA